MSQVCPRRAGAARTQVDKTTERQSGQAHGVPDGDSGTTDTIPKRAAGMETPLDLPMQAVSDLPPTLGIAEASPRRSPHSFLCVFLCTPSLWHTLFHGCSHATAAGRHRCMHRLFIRLCSQTTQWRHNFCHRSVSASWRGIGSGSSGADEHCLPKSSPGRLPLACCARRAVGSRLRSAARTSSRSSHRWTTTKRAVST